MTNVIIEKIIILWDFMQYFGISTTARVPHMPATADMIAAQFEVPNCQPSPRFPRNTGIRHAQSE